MENNTFEQAAQYEAQPVPQPAPQPAPQAPVYQPELEEAVSVGDWIGTLLLFSFVPCIGFILCLVWAFSKNTKKSKANFCKAYLIIMLISVVLSVVLGVVFGGVIAAAMANVGYYY